MVELGLAQAAVHLARGRAERAVETCERTLEAPALRTPRAGVLLMVRELLEQVRAEAARSAVAG
jgi:hypothetical protein